MSGRVGRTAATYFVAQLVTTFAGFAATWYINVSLGASAYGVFSTAVGLLFWLNVPASTVGNAVKKRTSEGIEPDAFLTAGHALNVGINVCLAAALVALSTQINAFVGADVAGIFAVLVVGRAFFEVTVTSLQGYKQVDVSGELKALERVLRAGIHIGSLFFLGVGVAGLVAGYAASVLVVAGAGLVLLDGRYARPNQGHVRSLVAYGRFAWLGTLKTRAFAWTDVLVMRGLSLSTVGFAAVSAAQIGIYKLAWTFASVFALASIGIKLTLFPELSELNETGDVDRIHHYITEAVSFAGIIAIPGLFGAVAVGDRLLTVFGAEYARGGTILVLLIVARLIATYSSQLLSAINAIDRPDVAFRVNFAFVFANVSLNLVLVSLFGWYGAAAATIASSVVSLLAAGYALSRLIGRPRVDALELGRQVFASVVMLGVVLGLRRLLPESLDWVLVVVCVGAVVYGTTLLAVSTAVRGKVAALAPTDIDSYT